MRSDLLVGLINNYQAKAFALMLEFERDFKNKKGRELSDEEKFYIGFCSCLKIENISWPEEINGTYTVKIVLEKSVIEWDGNKFLVLKTENNRDEREE